MLISDGSLLSGEINPCWKMWVFFSIKPVVLHGRGVLLGRDELSDGKGRHQDPNDFKGQESLVEGPTAPSPQENSTPAGCKPCASITVIYPLG